MSRIKNSKDKALFSTSDLPASVILFLNEGFDEYDQDKMKKVGYTTPLFQIDSSVFLKKNTIHIALSDVERLPGKNKPYIWPLSHEMILDIYEEAVGDKKILLRNLMHIMNSTLECNRYFTYSATRNNNVTLSWIENLDGKQYPPSSYLQLLNKKFNIPIEEYYKKVEVKK